MKKKLILIVLNLFTFMFVIAQSNINKGKSSILPNEDSIYYFCNSLSSYIELRNWKLENNQRKYVVSELWDEYTPTDSQNPIPDTLDVILNIGITNFDAKVDFDYTDSKMENIKVNLTLQLKYSIESNCLYPINPKIEKEEILLSNKIIKYDDFFIKKDKDTTYKIISLRQIFKIKEEVKKFISKNPYYKLNQLIMHISYEGTKSHNKCVEEYIHFICIKTPECTISVE